ncbi:MAG TPA: DUF3592 domain-containing protein [Gemmatimonadaceae bacterium]|jgi:hypothetical protein|nr:DUF3592 domain-containing protein [Gemmatimonadaceae bacterium]
MRTKFTRRQRSEIERNARVKRERRQKVRLREELRALVVVLAVCGLGILVLERTRLGDMPLPWWAIIVPGGALFFLMGLRTLVRQLRAARWPATTCRIEFTDIEALSSRVGTFWQPVVSYVYQVEGKEYTSDVLRIIGPGLSYSDAAARVSRYVPGTTRRCYFNPANPKDAVLERRINFHRPILFMAIGVGVPLWVYLSP